MTRLALASAEVDASIGRRLSALRGSVGLTQDAMSQRLGCSKRAYIAWELGQREPPARLLVGLKREFGVDPAWVLEGPGDIPRTYPANIDPKALYDAIELVRDCIHEAHLKPSKAEEMDLIAETYRLIIESPQAAPRVIRAALKIDRGK